MRPEFFVVFFLFFFSVMENPFPSYETRFGHTCPAGGPGELC